MTVRYFWIIALIWSFYYIATGHLLLVKCIQMSNINKLLRRLLRVLQHATKSVWCFPILVIICLLTLTAFGVSGSSVNVYDHLLDYPEGTNNLIVGQPRVIRSDEWSVNTAFTLSQANNNFPLINKDIGEGQDMSVVIDVPYRDWSILFKPQNLSFFVLPLQNAFAFKWWFLAAFLAIATYAFVLLIRPRSYLLAGLLATAMVFSPFVQWWYQAITILPMAYTLSLVVLSVHLYRAKGSRKKLILSAAFAYAVAAFALIMYPPFQIACALVGAALVFAFYFADNKQPFKQFIRKRLWLWYGSAILVAFLIILLFVFQHRDTVQTILSTSYPGKRIVASGGADLSDLSHWPMNYLLLRGGPLTPLGDNQSEASSFLFFGVLLLPFLLYWAVRHRRGFRKTRMFYSLLIASVVTLAVFSLRAFVSFGDTFYKFLGLESVPHVRLLIGTGIVNITLLALAFLVPVSKERSWRTWSFHRRGALTFGYAATATLTGLLFISRPLEQAGAGIKEIVAVSLFCGIITGLLAHQYMKLRYLGAVAITLFSVGTSALVNPLYRGFGGLTNSNIATSIKELEIRDDARWIATDLLNIEPVIIAAGAETLSGVQTYPQLNVWSRYFPDSGDIYNRYAHITYEIDDSTERREMILRQGDAYRIRINSCDNFLKDMNVNYIIGVNDTPERFQCFIAKRTVHIGDRNIAIFERK